MRITKRTIQPSNSILYPRNCEIFLYFANLVLLSVLFFSLNSDNNDDLKQKVPKILQGDHVIGSSHGLYNNNCKNN